MYRLDREEFVESPHVALWGTLGFQAGYINAFGFLACGRYVSHVTGFGTQIGVAMANQTPLFALELLGFPFFFILGSFVNSLLTAVQIEQKKKPRFDRVTLLLPSILVVLIVAGELGAFGPFGEQLVLARDFFLLYLLSFFCGMQNGSFAVLTKGQIRTTHLTGISTDIGTDLARIWFGKLDPKERLMTRKVNFSRIVTFASFASGSVASVLISQKLDYLGLLLPLATSIGVFLAVRSVSRKMDIKFSTPSLKTEVPTTLRALTP